MNATSEMTWEVGRDLGVFCGQPGCRNTPRPYSQSCEQHRRPHVHELCTETHGAHEWMEPHCAECGDAMDPELIAWQEIAMADPDRLSAADQS